MRLPSFRVRSALVAVVVVAIDLLWVRSIQSRPPFRTGNLHVVLLGSLPMANLLAIGVVRLIQTRGRISNFLRGFMACGLIALFAYVRGTVINPDSVDAYIEDLYRLFDKSYPIITKPAFTIQREVFYSILLCVSQMLFALAGGALAQGCMPGRRKRPVVDSGRSALGVRSIALLVALVAIPALLTEYVLELTVDPEWVRLDVGTIACFLCEMETGPSAGSTLKGFLAPGPNKFVFLPNGARVRIEADDHPFSYPIPGMGELRNVRATILDGEDAGAQASLPRRFLRPLR